MAGGSLGAYYFESSSSDIATLVPSWTRLAVPWSEIEPAEEAFDWTAVYIRRLDRALSLGMGIVPHLRCAPPDWAGGTPTPGADAPPADLTEDEHPDFGYSRTWYAFCAAFAWRYFGDLHRVVICNEVAAANFWTGTMDQYRRVLATAARAFHDTDLTIQVADSGLASPVWGLLHADELLTGGDAAGAIALYNGYLSETAGFQPVADETALRAALARKSVVMDKGREVLTWVDSVANTLNFHFYERPAYLPGVLAFLRSHSTLPLCCTELGMRLRPETPDRMAEAARDIHRKVLPLLAAGVGPVVLFSFTNPDHNIVGILDESQAPLQPTWDSFATVLADYDHPWSSVEKRSEPSPTHYALVPTSGGTTHAGWSDPPMTVQVPSGWQVHTWSGVVLPPGPITVADEPRIARKLMVP